jgi:hypothetical protein
MHALLDGDSQGDSVGSALRPPFPLVGRILAIPCQRLLVEDLARLPQRLGDYVGDLRGDRQDDLALVGVRGCGAGDVDDGRLRPVAEAPVEEVLRASDGDLPGGQARPLQRVTE